MRALVVLVFVAVVAALPLAAQQELRVVRGLSFEGNHAISTELLSEAIATTNSSAFASSPWLRWMGMGEKRYFDELEFRRDVVRLLLLYRQSGYLAAVIDTTVRRDEKDVYVRIRITEGVPVRVTKLSITGLWSGYDTAQLRRELPLHIGDPFNRFLLQASADTIVARLRNSGFPWATVLRNFDSDAATLAAEVSLDAQPGPRARIGQVQVVGVTRVDTSTVLRTLSIHPGDVFNQDRLYESQRDLYGLGTFRSAEVRLLDTLPGGTGDTLVRVEARVSEGPHHAVRIGVGYGTVDCFRAQTGWTAYDFFGGGRTFDVSGRVSKLGVGYPTRANFEQNICGYLQHDSTSDTLNYSLGATVTQPAFLNPRHSASLGVFTERRSEYQTYVRQEVGSNIGVTLNTRRAVPVVLAYQFSVGRTSANAAVYCSEFQVCKDSDQTFLAESRRFAAVTATLVRNKLDWVLDPSRGSLAILNVMYSSRFVGSDAFYEFNRGELQVAGYAPLGTRTTFAVRLRTGTILPQSITLSGQSAQFVPPEQRFYAGGPNSVRGYRLNQLGPRVYVTQDSTTIDTTTKGVAASPTGGNSVFVLNTELRVPAPVLPQRLRFALFVDMGQVWERREEIFSFTNLRITPGVGLRLTTPLGPVRLDAAYKHYADEPGPVYYLNPTTGELRRIRDSYQPPRPEGFWNRVLVQFAVGQTF